MAGMDGTGPQNMGPMTGRGMGKCNPESSANVSNAFGFGRGRGCGRGRGIGRGNNFSVQDEKARLEARLAEINKNL